MTPSGADEASGRTKLIEVRFTQQVFAPEAYGFREGGAEVKQG